MYSNEREGPNLNTRDVSHNLAPQMFNVTVLSRPASASAHLCRCCLIQIEFGRIQSRVLTYCPVQSSPFFLAPVLVTVAREFWAGWHLFGVGMTHTKKGTGHLAPGTCQTRSARNGTTAHPKGSVCFVRQSEFSVMFLQTIRFGQVFLPFLFFSD